MESKTLPARTPAAPLGRPWLQRSRAYGNFWLLAAGILVLDQLTKVWLAAHIPYGAYTPAAGAREVVPGFFYLIHVGNTGAAWSLFAGRSILLALLAAATLGAIYWWRKPLAVRDPFGQVCFGLLCGGIAGNLCDRLRLGHVVDFIDLHFGSYVYPTFNVADSGICVGVVLYLGHSLLDRD